jgi:uncharacterized protein with HEPN domain
MDRPDAHQFLVDIQRAYTLIREFIQDASFEDYTADAKTHSAVERQLEILGVALGRMLREYPEFEGVLADAPRILALRDLLLHRYSDRSHRAVWDVLVGSLPKLAREVDELLAEPS